MITRNDVMKAAALARVRLSTDDVESIATDLGRVVEWMAQLQSVDTTGVEPLMQPHLHDGVLRSDEARPVLAQRALAGSAGFEDGLVRVPRVID